MEHLFDQNIREFIRLCAKHDVRMILVGGGAVNFHGYQRHSADVDFWIDLDATNLQHLKNVLLEMGFAPFDFPLEVEQALMNISIKISPVTDLELITRFSPGKTFTQAYEDSVLAHFDGLPALPYHVLSYDDLILSKVQAGRPKDLLDITELKRLNQPF